MSGLLNYLPRKPIDNPVSVEARSRKARGANRSPDRTRGVRGASAKSGRRSAVTAPAETPKATAIYIRQQTGKSADIVEQLCVCHKYAAERKLNVIRTYYDEGSANLHLRDRPGLCALLKDAEAQKFDAVLMEDEDRLSRDIVALTWLLSRFRSLGVEVFTLSGAACDAVGFIRRIFDDYLRRIAPAEIAKRLNAEVAA